jgi:hypothetical protein
LADKYNYVVDGVGESTTASLSASVKIGVGGTHFWDARARNTSCGTDVSAWSSPLCYFCYEKGNCLPACGQKKYCSDGDCPETDMGKPLAPTLIKPGTETNPVSKLPGPVTLKWTPANGDILTDVWRIQLTKLSNGTTITITGIDVGTSKQVVDNLATGKVYSWEVWGRNTDCNDKVDGDRAIGYFVLNSPPEVTNLRLNNCDGTKVGIEGSGSGKNHICQDDFRECSNPRQVTFVATVSDPEGWENIAGGTLTWHGHNYDMFPDPSTGSLLSVKLVATVDFTDWENNTGLYPLSVTVNDIYGASGNGEFRKWKVWDCLVSTSGTIFDGSAGQACNSTGFTTLADSKLEFSTV